MLASLAVGCRSMPAAAPEPPKLVEIKNYEAEIVESLTDHADFEQLVIVSPEVAWALGPDGAVLKSTDGAKTFHVSRSPVLTKLAEESRVELLDLAAASSRVAWIVERTEPEEQAHAVNVPTARLHRTEDGGRTWSTSALRTKARSNGARVHLSVVDESRGYIGLADFDEERGTFGQEIFRTADSGRTWRRLSSVLTDAPIVFQSEKVLSIASPNFDSSQAIFRSVDGGLTWKSTSIPATTRNDGIQPTSAITFFGPGNAEGVMIGFGGDLVLYRSHNGGESWQIDARRHDVTFCGGAVGEYGAFAVVTEMSSTKTLLVRSTRHGFWDQVAELPMACPSYVRVFSTTDLYVGSVGEGDRAMYHSTDGGRTWREVGQRVAD